MISTGTRAATLIRGRVNIVRTILSGTVLGLPKCSARNLLRKPTPVGAGVALNP